MEGDVGLKTRASLVQLQSCPLVSAMSASAYDLHSGYCGSCVSPVGQFWAILRSLTLLCSPELPPEDYLLCPHMVPVQLPRRTVERHADRKSVCHTSYPAVEVPDPTIGRCLGKRTSNGVMPAVQPVWRSVYLSDSYSLELYASRCHSGLPYPQRGVFGNSH